MKPARHQSRDTRENRFEREEKLGQAMETLPGKTLRDRSGAARKSPKSSGAKPESKVPAVPPIARRAVPFELRAPEASVVQLAGSFNRWNPGAAPLAKASGGVWRVVLELDPGQHEYRFVVDGVWQEDPAAVRSVANPFGGRNSILDLP